MRPVSGQNRKLNIGAARVYAYPRMMATDASRIRWYSRSVSVPPVRDGDTVARVHAHGVQVFDGTDDYDIIMEIPHYLQFIFFPADNGFFDKNSPLRGWHPFRI